MAVPSCVPVSSCVVALCRVDVMLSASARHLSASKALVERVRHSVCLQNELNVLVFYADSWLWSVDVMLSAIACCGSRKSRRMESA